MQSATYRKNISPGNDIYIISRFVHSPVLFLIMKPTRPPTKTPITVAIVSTFSCIKLLNLLLASCLGLVILSAVYVNKYSARGSTHFQVRSLKLTFDPASQTEVSPCRDLRGNQIFHRIYTSEIKIFTLNRNISSNIPLNSLAS